MFGPHRELYVSIFPKDTFPNGVAQIMKICEQSDLFYQLTADIFIFDLFVHKPQMSDLSDKTGLCVYTAHLQIRHFFFFTPKITDNFLFLHGNIFCRYLLEAPH